MKGLPTLHVALEPSRSATALVAVAHLSTAALTAFLPGPALYRALAVVAIGAHALWTLRLWALRTARGAIVGLEVGGDGHVVLCERSGRRCEGRLQAASYVGTWLTTVVVRIDGLRTSRAVAILPDMLPPEDLRQLRVVLRIAGSASRPEVWLATPRHR